jgi:hypothetical protein
MIHAEQANEMSLHSFDTGRKSSWNVRAERQQQQQNNERSKGAIICDAVHLEQ